MFRISDNKQSLAALAIFKRLYNAGKDVFQVISEFEKYLILRDHMPSFTTVELGLELERNFGIEVPLSIIKAALKRLGFVVKGSSNGYTIDESYKNQSIDNFKREVQNLNIANKDVINQLVTFVKNKKGEALSEDDVISLSNAFYSYVLGEPYPDDYAGYISTFFINHEGDEGFIRSINDIMGGAIIIAGLNYNTTETQIDNIDMPICMYLETEILFHMAGYNGNIYKRLFDEFYDLVVETNKKCHKELVKLFYFEETKDECDKYFQAAEKIVRKGTLAQAGQTAMINIVKGCKEATDIADKKAEFYSELEAHKINLDEQNNYYDREKYKLNIEDSKYVNNNDPEGAADKVALKLKLLNFIHIKRGGRGRSVFRNIGHLMISGNSITLKMANDSDVIGNDLPLAFSLSYITNRLWLSLHKKLVGDNTPISASILNRSIIILDKEARKALVQDYQEMTKAHNSGKITDKDVKERLAQYHNLPKSVDELTDSESADNVLNFINNSLQDYIEERDNERQESERNKMIARKAIDELFVKEREDAILQHKKQIISFQIKRKQYFIRHWKKAICEGLKSLTLLLVFSAVVIIAGILGIKGIDTGHSIISSVLKITLYLIVVIAALLPYFIPQEVIKELRHKVRIICAYKDKRKMIIFICAKYERKNARPKINLPSKEQIEKQLLEQTTY